MMQKRTGRSRHRGKKTLQGCTSTKLRLCYGVPCAVLVVVWSLFLLLNSTFSHSDDDHLRADIQQIKQPWRSILWNEKSSKATVGEPGFEAFGAQQCPLPEAESVSFDCCLLDLNQNGSRPAPPSSQKEAQLANSSNEEAETDTNRPHQKLKVQVTGSLVGSIQPSTVESNSGEPENIFESGGIGTGGDSAYLSNRDLSPNDDRGSQLDGDLVVGEASQFHKEFGSREGHNEPVTEATDSGGCATEGCPKLCLVEEPGVSSCQLQVSEGKTITPLWRGSAQTPDGLTCSDETTLLKNICDSGSLDDDSGKQPLDDFLLCLRDPLTGTATCEPLCSSSARTTLTKSVSGVCLCRSPLLDIIVNRVPASPDANPQNSKLSSQLSLGASESEFLTFTGDLPESALKVSNQGLSNDEGAGIVSLLTEDGIVTVGAEVREGSEIQEGRPSRTGHVVSLDEYKRSVIDKKEGLQNVTGSASPSIHIRHQHRDSGYNHADAAHGAKLVACNKEAKGAGHILVFDKDKYLRNPCSAEDKFVVVELSEETLVDNIVLANFEFHSSNVKEFELLGSPDVYPTDEWIPLGKFEAENVRHAQKFTLAEPKWVRCLMLRLVSHYGAEFYCTLSMFQVHGVDAIELLLEDWIGEEGDSGARRSSSVNTAQLQDESTLAKPGEAAESGTATQALPLGTVHSAGGMLQGSSGSLDTPTAPAQNMHVARGEHAPAPEVVSFLVRGKEEDSKWFAGESFQDVVSQHSQAGRPSGDSLMKILMQKVKSLELNQSLFDGYLEDLNQKYREMFNGLDQDIASLTARLKSETATSSTLSSRLLEIEVKRAIETAALENKFVRQFQQLNAEIDFLRSRSQHMESRESLVVAVAILFMLVSPVLYLTLRCISPRRASRYRSRSPLWLQQSQLYSRNHYQSFGISYFLLFLVSAFIALVLSV